MKYILSVLFLFFFFSGFTQIYQEMPQYGYRANRMAFDSTLQIPTVCGVPTLKSVVSVNKKSAIAFDSCNNRFYTYNPKTQVWSIVSGGGATATLQSVTDSGNTTNKQIIINNNNNYGFFHKSNDILGIRTYVSEDDNESYMEVYNPNDNTVKSLYTQSSIQYVKSGNRTSIGYETPTQLNNIIMPNSSGRLALSVNGQFADSAGSITIPTIDTLNKFVNNVVKKNDSTITVYKGTTATDITLTPSTTVASATRLVTTVYNNSGSTITKGSVIYINGRHSSNLPTIALAQANTENNSYATFALVQDDITNNNSGTIIQAGNISNLNLPTASFADGEVVYLSPTVAGGLTTNKTSVLAPNHIVKIGTITRAHPTFGSIEIRIENGWQLDELSDVQIPIVPNDSTLLQFSRVDSLWHDVSVTNAIGNKYLKPTDSVSLSNRINLKVNIADTASMLSPYLRSNTASATYLAKTDTASLSSRINLKLNISDTSTMLSPYIRLAGTGLTKSSQTLSNNLSTGVAGGQSVVGGTAASDNLTLSSTSNATKGKILFGTSAYDEVNNRLGIGTSSPTHPIHSTTSTTASGKFARGAYLNNTLVAAANNDTLIGMHINPTYTNGSFTGVSNLGLRIDKVASFGFNSGGSAEIRCISSNGAIDFLGASDNKSSFNFYGGGVYNSGAGITVCGSAHPTWSNRINFVRGAYIQSGFISANGNWILNTGDVDAGYKLDVNGTARANQFQLSALNTAPATSTSTGTTGEIRIVNGFIYVCVATNTWQRATLSTF